VQPVTSYRNVSADNICRRLLQRQVQLNTPAASWNPSADNSFKHILERQVRLNTPAALWNLSAENFYKHFLERQVQLNTSCFVGSDLRSTVNYLLLNFNC